LAAAAWRERCCGNGSSSVAAAAAAWPRQAAWQQWQQLGGSTAAAAAAAAQRRQWQFCRGRQLGSGSNSLAAAAWRQPGRGGRLLLVVCFLVLPPPLLLPPVSLLPPFLSLNSKNENTIFKIVSYQYFPNWNCLLFKYVLFYILRNSELKKTYSLGISTTYIHT
jgi:hypothetical protein